MDLWKLYDYITSVNLELHFWDLVQCLLISFCFGSETLKKIGSPQPLKKQKKKPKKTYGFSQWNILPMLWVRRLGFGTVFTNIILLWIQIFFSKKFFFQIFFPKFFFSKFFFQKIFPKFFFLNCFSKFFFTFFFKNFFSSKFFFFQDFLFPKYIAPYASGDNQFRRDPNFQIFSKWECIH